MSTKPIAVIGGGCAGLSAAATLAERGHAVTLFESSPQLGGRARSVAIENKDLSQALDNGQHIMLGAYRETLGLLEKAGVNVAQAFERLPLSMHIKSGTGQTDFSLQSWTKLPAPFNLLMGFLCCKGLHLGERYTALRFMHRLQSSSELIKEDIPLDIFLEQHRQSKRLMTLLWEPLCLAALNTPIHRASSRIFLNVLKDSFSSDKHNSDFLLPRLDLSQIIAQPLAHYIQAKGGTIQCSHRVRSIHADNDELRVETSQGTSHFSHVFSHVVVATSPATVDQLIADIPQLRHTAQQTQAFTFQPIYTIYLQYPADTRLPSSMIGLTGTTAQWVFDRGRLCQQLGLLAVIISAEGAHQQMSQAQLALVVAQELKQVFPQLAQPFWHQVITEKRATFSCNAGLSRPGNTTALPNLYLAGDYTYEDYPATIEGAVRSGIRCADLISDDILKGCPYVGL